MEKVQECPKPTEDSEASPKRSSTNQHEDFPSTSLIISYNASDSNKLSANQHNEYEQPDSNNNTPFQRLNISVKDHYVNNKCIRSTECVNLQKISNRERFNSCNSRIVGRFQVILVEEGETESSSAASQVPSSTENCPPVKCLKKNTSVRFLDPPTQCGSDLNIAGLNRNGEIWRPSESSNSSSDENIRNPMEPSSSRHTDVPGVQWWFPFVKNWSFGYRDIRRERLLDPFQTADEDNLYHISSLATVSFYIIILSCLLIGYIISFLEVRTGNNFRIYFSLSSSNCAIF